MRRIVHVKPGRENVLHVETPLGIVNITVGLHDYHGREVESIEVIPNTSAGEQKVVRRGYCNTRLVQLIRMAGEQKKKPTDVRKMIREELNRG